MTWFIVTQSQYYRLSSAQPAWNVQYSVDSSRTVHMTKFILAPSFHLVRLEERRKGDGLICSWLSGLELLKTLYFFVKLSLQKSTSMNWAGMQSPQAENIDMKAFTRTKWGFLTLLLSRTFTLKSLRVFNFYKVIIFKVKKVQLLLLKTSCCKRNGILLQIT